jgi:hypothetical protein
MTEAGVRRIIAALAEPELIHDFSSLCPDRKELTTILLDILKGLRSPYYPDLREAAERQHVDVCHLTRKAGFILASLSLDSSKDYYSILEVDQQASTEEIREKWAEKIQVYHPDKYDDPTGWIAQQARSLNEAYAVLKDPEKRRAYDDARKARGRGSRPTQVGYDCILPPSQVHSASPARYRSKLPVLLALATIAIAIAIIGLLLWPW